MTGLQQKDFTLWRMLRRFGWRHPVRVWRQWRMWRALARRPFGPIVVVRSANLDSVVRTMKRVHDEPAEPVRTRAQVLEDWTKGGKP